MRCAVLQMRVIRHEENLAPCPITCNGQSQTAWSKTMVGYDTEDKSYALEITYNYGAYSAMLCCAPTPHRCLTTLHCCARTLHCCLTTPHCCLNTPHCCAPTLHCCLTQSPLLPQHTPLPLRHPPAASFPCCFAVITPVGVVLQLHSYNPL